jgi:hypothetical protein
MSDITRESIRAWRDAALLQFAAESYFQGSNLLDPLERLTRGNTPLDNNEADQQQYIRMAGTESVSQALDFMARHEIVDQHPNDATGFSATVIREKASGLLTIAFRSTEYSLPRPGELSGDILRDGPHGADGEVGFNGCDAPPCLRDRASWNHLAPSSDLSTQVAS